MIFLNPLPLYSWLFIFIPLIIFIINRRKLKNIKFSSIKYLIGTKSINIKRIKFSNILLLVIRTLLILLILTIIMKPINKDSTLISSNGKLINIILINDSFSNKQGNVNGIKRIDFINQIVSSISNEYPLDTKLKIISINKGLLYNGFNKKNISYKTIDSKKDIFNSFNNELKNEKSYLKNIHIISDDSKESYNKIETFYNNLNTKKIFFHYIPKSSNNQFINNVKLLDINDNNTLNFEVNIGNTANISRSFVISVNQKKYLYNNKNISASSVPIITKEITVPNNSAILDTISINIKINNSTEIEFLLESKNINSINNLDDDKSEDNSFSYVFNVPDKINLSIFYNDEKLKNNIKKILDSFKSQIVKIDSNILNINYIKTRYLEHFSKISDDKNIIMFLGYNIFEKSDQVVLKKFCSKINNQVIVMPSENDFTKDSFNFNINDIKSITSKINNNYDDTYDRAYEYINDKSVLIKNFKLFDYFYHQVNKQTLIKNSSNQGIWTKYKINNGTLDLLGFTISDKNVFLKDQMLYLLPLFYNLIIYNRLSYTSDNYSVNEQIYFPNTENIKKVIFNSKNDSLVFYDEYSPQFFSKDIKIRLLNNRIDNIYSFNQNSIDLKDSLNIDSLSKKDISVIKYNKNISNKFHEVLDTNKFLNYLIYLLLLLFILELYISNSKPPKSD